MPVAAGCLFWYLHFASSPDSNSAAVTTAVSGASQEGGANLLERIFDRVKDMLFDSGSSTSPVQLPVQQASVPSEQLEALRGAPEPVVQESVEDSAVTGGADLDDGL